MLITLISPFPLQTKRRFETAWSQCSQRRGYRICQQPTTLSIICTTSLLGGWRSSRKTLTYIYSSIPGLFVTHQLSLDGSWPNLHNRRYVECWYHKGGVSRCNCPLDQCEKKGGWRDMGDVLRSHQLSIGVRGPQWEELGVILCGCLWSDWDNEYTKVEGNVTYLSGSDIRYLIHQQLHTLTLDNASSNTTKCKTIEATHIQRNLPSWSADKNQLP